MRYGRNRIKKATFVSRPNRFISIVELDGQKVKCHMNNTGRCKQLLHPGCEVFVLESDNPDRKTSCDLVAVKTPHGVVNMDSLAPNRLFGEWAASGNFKEEITFLKPECVYPGGSSRFDYYIEYGKEKMFVEVKGVTLRGDEETGISDRVAMFPDAPTQRGVKHLKELCHCISDGYRAAICFVITMSGITSFRPAAHIHPEFAAALKEASDAGVEVHALVCQMSEDGVSVEVTGEVEVRC